MKQRLSGLLDSVTKSERDGGKQRTFAGRYLGDIKILLSLNGALEGWSPDSA